MTTDPLTRARNYDDRPRSSWDPDVGDVIGGTVVELDVRSTKYDDRVPVVTVETEDGGELVSIWCFWTVLRQELKDLAPQEGDRIAVRRLEDSSKGYRRFKAFSDRDEAEDFEWGAIDEEAGDVAPSDREDLFPRTRDVEEEAGEADFSDEALTGGDDRLPF